eukprot:GHRQ01025994.1.p1 GENE.GHRQ01025994.1~~GHRQ01025994.1.p1  ORF type:complete len:147 (-),score=17.72 GHRQ01025994.1:127-567(-)
MSIRALRTWSEPSDAFSQFSPQQTPLAADSAHRRSRQLGSPQLHRFVRLYVVVEHPEAPQRVLVWRDKATATTATAARAGAGVTTSHLRPFMPALDVLSMTSVTTMRWSGCLLTGMYIYPQRHVASPRVCCLPVASPLYCLCCLCR